MHAHNHTYAISLLTTILFSPSLSHPADIFLFLYLPSSKCSCLSLLSFVLLHLSFSACLFSFSNMPKQFFFSYNLFFALIKFSWESLGPNYCLALLQKRTVLQYCTHPAHTHTHTETRTHTPPINMMHLINFPLPFTCALKTYRGWFKPGSLSLWHSIMIFVLLF